MNKILVFIFVFTNLLFAQKLHSVHEEHMNEFGSKTNFVSKKNSGEIKPLNLHAVNDLEKVVFGYLPYWERNNATIKYDLISHIACFDFKTDKHGNITLPSGWPWTNVINNAHENGVKVIMTLTNSGPDGFSSDIINFILDNDESQTNLITNISQIINDYKLDGVNLDIESIKTADRGDRLNQLVERITNTIHFSLPGKEVSFAGPATNWGGWKLNELAASCDLIFIMGYAFAGGWSDNAGPTAPLTGGYKNITTTVTEDYKEAIENYPERIVLGVPYYGNKWKVKDEQENSEAVDYITSVRFRNEITDYSHYEKFWSGTYKVPWFNYYNGSWYQVWLDDEESLELKYDLALEHDIAGIGMWALGYDGTRNELWDLIEKKFVTGTDIKDEKLIIEEFRLIETYPNPFNSFVNIKFYSSQNENIDFSMYNVLGQKILSKKYSSVGSGEQTVKVELNNLSSGNYIFTMSNGKQIVSGKLSLLK